MAGAAKASSTTGAIVHSLSSRRPSSGAKVRAVRWRRSTSRARFFAVAMSQADGFSGRPRTFHTSSARQKASWTTSSARVRLCTPKIRVSAATMRPDSWRKRCSLRSNGLGRSRASLLMWCVAEHDVARGIGPGLQEVQPRALGQAADQRLAAAEEDGADDEAVLVDEPVLGELRRDRAAAEDEHVGAGLLLHGFDLARIERAEEARGLPP